LLALWRTSIGKKMVMAITGAILAGFVLVHMLGNLKLYQGRDKMNAYGEFLREVGMPLFPRTGLLWIARGILLGAATLHIVAAAQLTMRSLSARPDAYSLKGSIAQGYAARTMRWSGPIIGLFAIYHVLHFTFGKVGFGGVEFVEGDVYGNVVKGFSLWYVSALYIAAMAALGFHLRHGVWSLFQTLGINSRQSDRRLRRLASVFAGVVVAGNISFPIAVLIGLIRLEK